MGSALSKSPLSTIGSWGGGGVLAPVTGGASLLPALAGGEGKVDYEGMDSGYPNQPAFQSIINPKTGVAFDQFQVKPNSYMDEENKRMGAIPSVNTDPLHALESYGTGTGDSPWATAQLDALKQSAGQAQGNAAASARSAGTSAMDAAGAHGGLTSGMAENLSRNSANNEALARQGVWGQAVGQQGQIRSQDAQNRLGVLENLPGQEVQAVQPAIQEQSLWQNAAAQNQANDTRQQEYNTGNLIGDIHGQNPYNMQQYGNQINQQAGSEMAAAQSNRGKK